MFREKSFQAAVEISTFTPHCLEQTKLVISMFVNKIRTLSGPDAHKFGKFSVSHSNIKHLFISNKQDDPSPNVSASFSSAFYCKIRGHRTTFHKVHFC
jgi:hypothetical protein